jgi:hypothetical protein
MKREMVDAIISLTEKNRFTKGIFGYVGFKTKFIPFTHAKREIGTTKWGLIKLFKYAFHGILAFSIAPLKLPMVAGIASIISSAAIALAQLISRGFAPWSDVAIIAAVVTLVGGVQMIALGVVAEYLSKMYVEIKDRPSYFIRRTLDHESLAEVAERYIADDSELEASND